MTADSRMLRLKFQPSTSSSSLARAYIEIPEEKTVMTAKDIALNPRVFVPRGGCGVPGPGRGGGAVVERHHEDADEHHGGDRAKPVEVAGHHPVLGARGRHPDDFLGAEVGRDERQPGYPRGH